MIREHAYKSAEVLKSLDRGEVYIEANGYDYGVTIQLIPGLPRTFWNPSEVDTFVTLIGPTQCTKQNK